MRYAVVVEKAVNNYSAYVPDLPGCVATGQTIEEAEREIREAIEFQKIWGSDLVMKQKKPGYCSIARPGTILWVFNLSYRKFYLPPIGCAF